jgi:hypothetical protein
MANFAPFKVLDPDGCKVTGARRQGKVQWDTMPTLASPPLS